jgi:IclR family transcriptional regulator, pca regulon regulatory protein
MNAEPFTVQDRDVVNGLENGLAIIEAFGPERPRLSLSEAAAATGLTRAAARRYLLTLMKLGYASFDGKFFSLTPRILRLGYAYLSASPLSARVQPFLEQISRTTGESSSAAILDGEEVVYIARSATKRIMSIALTVGSRLPAYCTSLGRAILAYDDPARVEAYLETAKMKPLTAKTKATPKAVREALKEVRRTGFALVDEELEEGLRSIAMPVFDSRERPVCAINVSVQAGRFSAEATIERLVPALREAQIGLRNVV